MEGINISIDTIWILLAACLVMFMQPGFALVESGFTRSKNTANILMKNLMDFSIGSLAFWIIGYTFMYGEDIDLSYRIQLGGYDNYYFPDTQIIHYKGESTKKSSVNYVFVFYNAMIIFAQKHFTKNNAQLFSFLINIAIYLRAGLAIISRLLRKLVLPFLDAATWYAGIYFIKIFIWKRYY